MRIGLHQLKQKHIWLPLLVSVLVLTPGVAFAIGESVQQGVYYMVTTVFGLLVRLGGTILDYGLQTYVFEFSDLYINNFGFAIDYLWRVVRDLFNLTFIFGLVYIGFRLIFRADDSHARKALVMLIGAALLVNFSLFFSKAVVDFSNLAAYEVAKGITVIGSGGNIAASQVEDGVAGQFLNLFGVQDIFDPKGLDFETLGENGGWAYTFGIMIVFMVAAFVFAAGGILLIVRFITLSILMIFSPIMFIGWVFPFFSSYSSMWWKKFLGQAFVAPAYIFMLYLSLYVLQAIGQGGGSLSEMFGPDSYTSGAGTLMIFLVGAGFLIASLVVAQKMGAAGANTAMSVGKNLRQRGQRVMGSATVGAAAGAGRQTVGRAGSAYAKSKFGQRMARKGGVAGTFGRSAISGADSLSKSSFDARQAAGMGKTLGIGEGKKGGYAQGQKDIEEKDKRMSKLIGTEDEQIYQDEGVEDMYEMHQQALQERDDAIAALSQETNESRREALRAEINRLEAFAKRIEENKITREDFPEFNGTDEEWENQLAQLRRYNEVRNNMRAILQNEFATNLSRRGDSLPPGVKHAYKAFIRSTRENRESASNIRKEVNKGKDERQTDQIIEALKESSKNNS